MLQTSREVLFGTRPDPNECLFILGGRGGNQPAARGAGKHGLPSGACVPADIHGGLSEIVDTIGRHGRIKDIPIARIADERAHGPDRKPRTWRSRHLSEGPPGIAATVERSEEHTSELQSHLNLVCRLL